MNILINTMLLFFIYSTPVFSYEIRTTIINELNQIEKKSIINCSTSDSKFCLNLCSNDNRCEIKEVSCVDCLGKKEQTFNLVFNHKLDKYYSKSANTLPQTLVQYFLKNQSFILLEHDSFLNYMTPENSHLILAQFQRICTNESSNNLIVISLDSETLSNPQLVGIICDNIYSKKSDFFALVPLYNPTQILSYWENLWILASQNLQNLNFTIDKHLNLNRN